jgi:hypothetical protein
MKQVPEGKQTVSEENQLQLLREKLMGNQAFAACRGNFGSIGDIYRGVEEKAKSPTHVLGQWDEFFGKVRIMVNILAQFQRDGLEVAHEQLLNALESPTYLFPGETVPLEQTSPVTFLLLEPKKTLLFLRWLLEGHWVELRNYIHGKECGELTKQLYAEFPTLEAHVRQNTSAYIGRDLCAAFKDAIVGSFPSKAIRRLKEAELVWHQWDDDVELRDLPIAFSLAEEQSEVMKLFGRRDQKRLTAWQFNPPKIYAKNYVGLHPVSIHEGLKDKSPALVSRGTSQGLGGIILDENPVMNRADYRTALNSRAKAGSGYAIAFDL